MSPITPLARALTALRKTLSARVGTAASPPGTPSAARQAVTANTAQGGDIAKLQGRIRQAVAHIDLSTEAGQQHAVRIFLETALSAEFGADVLNDPAFADMVVSVKQTMMADPATQQKLLAMLQGMAAGGVPAPRI